MKRYLVPVVLGVLVCSLALLVGGALPAQAAAHVPACSQHAKVQQIVRCGQWQVQLTAIIKFKNQLKTVVQVTNLRNRQASLAGATALSLDGVTLGRGKPIILIVFAPHQTRTLSPLWVLPAGLQHLVLRFHADHKSVVWHLA